MMADHRLVDRDLEHFRCTGCAWQYARVGFGGPEQVARRVFDTFHEQMALAHEQEARDLADRVAILEQQMDVLLRGDRPGVRRCAEGGLMADERLGCGSPATSGPSWQGRTDMGLHVVGGLVLLAVSLR